MRTLIVTLVLAGPLPAAEPPDYAGLPDRVQQLERRVTTVETKLLGTGTAGATVPTGVCECKFCSCGKGVRCGDPACPAATRKAPDPMPAAPIGTAPTPAHEWRDLGPGYGYGWGLRGVANPAPRAAVQQGGCPGGGCYPSFGTYAGPQNVGQRLMYFGGGCANGSCGR